MHLFAYLPPVNGTLTRYTSYIYIIPKVWDPSYVSGPIFTKERLLWLGKGTPQNPWQMEEGTLGRDTSPLPPRPRGASVYLPETVLKVGKRVDYGNRCRSRSLQPSYHPPIELCTRFQHLVGSYADSDYLDASSCPDLLLLH